MRFNIRLKYQIVKLKRFINDSEVQWVDSFILTSKGINVSRIKEKYHKGKAYHCRRNGRMQFLNDFTNTSSENCFAELLASFLILRLASQFGPSTSTLYNISAYSSSEPARNPVSLSRRIISDFGPPDLCAIVTKPEAIISTTPIPKCSFL